MRRRAEPLACLVLAAGLACALRIPPAPIGPHLHWPIDATATALPALGIGHFGDSRLAAEREGSAPPLRVEWRGLVRDGDNKTGDSDFKADVVEGLRADVASTLARSGDFSSVRRVGLDDGDGLEELGLDYLLVASIELFEGVQHQRSELSPFWIGWIRNRYGEPRGSVRVHYRLYDGAGLIWEDRIETRQRSPGPSVTGAVLDAMAMNTERLAGRLHAATRGELEARVVTVRVLDGCKLNPRGVAAELESAVLAFEREAGLRLSLEPEPWLPPTGAGLDEALNELVTSTDPPPDGIVLALMPVASQPRGWLPDLRYGIADPLGAHAVVGCNDAGAVHGVTMLHELGHLLGAIHVRDQNSVMHAVAAFDARFFDPLNRRILRTARTRPFGAALPAELRGRLEAIYRAAERFPDQVDAGAVSAALQALRNASLRTSPTAVSATGEPSSAADSRLSAPR